MGGDIAGWRVAVDLSVLLHGAIGHGSIAVSQVVQGLLAPTHALGLVADIFVTLQQDGVKPIAFFDGMPWPYKAAEAEQRQSRRIAAASEARRLAADPTPSQRGLMKKAAQKAEYGTPQLRDACVGLLKSHGIPVVGAAFEADGQMAWAYKHNLVDAVLTNDSELCVLGCKVLRIPAGRAVG
eukprot:6173952-Pleurochrysis_carterae.AAC.3